MAAEVCVAVVIWAAADESLEFLRHVRSLYPTAVRIAIVLGNFAPHLSKDDDLPLTSPGATAKPATATYGRWLTGPTWSEAALVRSEPDTDEVDSSGMPLAIRRPRSRP